MSKNAFLDAAHGALALTAVTAVVIACVGTVLMLTTGVVPAGW